MVEGQTMWQAASDYVNTGLVILDKSGGVVWGNKAFASLASATTPQALYAVPIQNILPLSNQPKGVKEWILERITMQTSFQKEIAISGNNGTTQWLEIHGTKHQSGHHVGEYLLMVEDVSQRKRYQNQLRESQSRFRMLSDNSAVMMWVTNAEGLVTFCNRAWTDFVGQPMEHELGFGWTKHMHPDEADHIMAQFTRMFALKKPFQVEYRLKRPDGSYGWLLERGMPMFEGDTFKGFMGTCFEITQRKNTEIALKQKSATLDRVIQEVINPMGNNLETLKQLVDQGNPKTLRAAIDQLAALQANAQSAIASQAENTEVIAPPDFIIL